MCRRRQAIKPQVDDTEDSDEEWMPSQQGEDAGGFKGVLKLTWVQVPAVSQELTKKTISSKIQMFSKQARYYTVRGYSYKVFKWVK